MANPNRVCIMCKKIYKYCGNCAADINKPTWKTIFCSNNCHDLYNTINDYRCEKLNKEDALAKLQALDLSHVDKLSEGAKKVFDEIVKVEEVEVVTEEVKIETKVTENNKVENNESVEKVLVISEEAIVESSEETTDIKIEQVEETEQEVIKEEIVKPRKKKAKSVE